MANIDPGALQYGPIIGGWNIDQALIATFKKWYRGYLNETARQAGESIDRFHMPRSYRPSAEIAFMPEDQRPCVLLMNNGVTEPPVRRGQSSTGLGQRVETAWEYHIAIQLIAQGKKQINSIPRAHELAMLYAAAARVMLVNVPLEGLNAYMDWKDEYPGDIEPDGERTAAIGVTVFNVTVPEAMIWGTAPNLPEPPEAPEPESPTWPPVTDPKHITIIKVPTGGE